MKLDAEAERALRARARNLQALHISLLFCGPTRERWTADPDSVLAAFGLNPADRGLIADIATEQFQAEAHGRRIVVERGIGRCFESTFRRLAERANEPDRPPDPDFDAFLCSEYFLEPGRGLPHRSGVGQGYENVSKWFFWLRDTFGLDRPDTDIALRTEAYAEFAIWLIDEYKRPHDPYFDQFQGGLFWPQVPGRALPVVVLTEDYKQVTINKAEIADQLPRIGLVDLDTLHPPAYRPEPPLT